MLFCFVFFLLYFYSKRKQFYSSCMINEKKKKKNRICIFIFKRKIARFFIAFEALNTF